MISLRAPNHQLALSPMAKWPSRSGNLGRRAQRTVFASILSIALLAASAEGRCDAQFPSEATAPISNHGRTPMQPYVTAGDRTYLIGTQDGNFPDVGQHVTGEMGGLWLPPIKLLDAFQAHIAEVGSKQEISLAGSAEMIAYPYGNRFIYGRTLDDIDVERFQYSPDGRPGLIVQRANIAAPMVSQDRSAPWLVRGPYRDQRRRGSGRVACRPGRLRRPGC